MSGEYIGRNEAIDPFVLGQIAFLGVVQQLGLSATRQLFESADAAIATGLTGVILEGSDASGDDLVSLHLKISADTVDVGMGDDIYNLPREAAALLIQATEVAVAHDPDQRNIA